MQNDIRQTLAIIFSLIGATCLILSGVAKDTKKTHRLQVVDCTAHTLMTILLQSWAGSLANFMSLVREIIAVRGAMTRTKQIILCVVMIALGCACNNQGLIGFLPIIGSSIYILVGCSPQAKYCTLKATLALNMGLWAIHDFYIGAYPTVGADLATVTMCIVAMVNYKNNTQKQETSAA